MAKTLSFTKMHGAGNDYIYFDCFKQTIEEPEKLAVQLSDRHKGIGGDGIILIAPSNKADLRMIMFNSDGSEGMMCGNGIRCVGKFAYDKGIVTKSEITVETKSGLRYLWLNIEDNKVSSVRVDMGVPEFAPAKIPVDWEGERIVNEKVAPEIFDAKGTCVSMGNPHIVFFVDKITDEHVLTIGPKIDRHPIFPERVNVEFAKIINDREIEMRVWERGSGETMASGTGSCATAVAAAVNKLTQREVTIHLRGGDLKINWAENNHVFMDGPATTVFEGTVEI